KNLSDTNGGRSAYFLRNTKALTATHQTHVFNALAVYELPLGKSISNAPPPALARGWRISTITRGFTRFPLGAIAASCNLPNAGACQAVFNRAFTGDVRINGDWGSGDLLGSNAPAFLDRNAFANPAAYTYGDTPLTGAFGVRAPHGFNQD